MSISVSKRDLGEAYIVATGVVLAVVLGAQLVSQGLAGVIWLVTSAASFGVLVGSVYWLQCLELTSDQVWTVANCSALGLGLGTTTLLVVEVTTTTAIVTSIGTAILGTTLAATAITGALGGVVLALYHSNRNLRGQNAVLHRVLRHNLRNDMSVVICKLDEIEANADDEETANAAASAREKIQSFVRLTDSVRQAEVGLTDPAKDRRPRDLTALVASRVDELERSNPELTVESDLPEETFVTVGETFELVVDNVVESVLSGEAAEPHLTVRVERTRETASILFEDESEAIPAPDLTAVASGSETALEHGFGVELWLVTWLVDANDGTVTFQSGADKHRIRIELTRTDSRWLG